MKKIIHAVAVYGPIILCGIIVLFMLPLVFKWFFVPYNGYLWCGISTAVVLLVCQCAKSDYENEKIPKIEETGILILAFLNSVWWVYVWSAVKYTVILPFAVACMIFILYLAVKICDDSVRRTLTMMVSAAMVLATVIILIVPLLTPMPIFKDRFSVYNGQGVVAKVTVIRDAGDVYDISVIAKKVSGDFGLGRFEESDEVSVIYEIVDVSDYQKPQLAWKGMDLYINGEKKDIYWK